MKSSNERPLTQEEAYAARLAMASRQEVDTALSSIAVNVELKKFCIAQAVDAVKQAFGLPLMIGKEEMTRYYAAELAREFHNFLTEK